MTDQPKSIPRPWWSYLRFSVRGLIVVVAVIGIWLGWIVRSARIQREAVAAIKSDGGMVIYDRGWSDGRAITPGKHEVLRRLADLVPR